MTRQPLTPSKPPPPRYVQDTYQPQEVWVTENGVSAPGEAGMTTEQVNACSRLGCGVAPGPRLWALARGGNGACGRVIKASWLCNGITGCCHHCVTSPVLCAQAVKDGFRVWYYQEYLNYMCRAIVEGGCALEQGGRGVGRGRGGRAGSAGLRAADRRPR